MKRNQGSLRILGALSGALVADSKKPMSRRFSDQRGVDVRTENYGKTESAPFYEPMYVALEGAGYIRDRDIRVAGLRLAAHSGYAELRQPDEAADRGHLP